VEIHYPCFVEARDASRPASSHQIKAISGKKKEKSIKLWMRKTRTPEKTGSKRG